MTDDEKVAVLQASGCFEGSRLRRLLPFFDELSVSALDCVVVEGEACHQLIVVAEGRLESFRGDRVEMLGAGDSCGWSAMERRGPNEATVIAATDARLLVMSHAQFRAASAPPANRRFLRWALPSSRRSLPLPANLSGA